MASFHVKSVQTGQWIITLGARPGEYVLTSHQRNGPGLRFSQRFPGTGATTVQDPINGLYVHPSHDSPSLVWKAERFFWVTVKTSEGYHFIPDNGDNLYWVQKHNTVPTITLLPGSAIRENENDFELVRE